MSQKFLRCNLGIKKMVNKLYWGWQKISRNVSIKSRDSRVDHEEKVDNLK